MNAEQENQLGVSALNSQRHHTACLDALKHFEQAAKIEPNNPKYETNAGVANQLFIQRWQAHIGDGALISIAIFCKGTPLGIAIDREHHVLETVSDDNYRLLVDTANTGLRWYRQAIAAGPSYFNARAWRTQFLRNVGAFSAALQDAVHIISNSGSDGDSRDTAADVRDYITSPSSELRRFISAADAEKMGMPSGVTL